VLWTWCLRRSDKKDLERDSLTGRKLERLLKVAQRSADKVPGLEEKVRQLEAEVRAMNLRFEGLNKESQRRVESKRRLDRAGLADFPAMLDAAIVDGTLRIRK
jgi:hypothetical protein